MHYLHRCLLSLSLLVMLSVCVYVLMSCECLICRHEVTSNLQLVIPWCEGGAYTRAPNPYPSHTVST